MPPSKIRLDSAGIESVLKSGPVAALVDSSAHAVAANASATTGHPVDVMTMTTDRARAVVMVKHPSAAGQEAKHGHLTRAASAAGLEVRAR